MSEKSAQIGGQPCVSVKCAGKDGENTAEHIDPAEGCGNGRAGTAVPAGGVGEAVCGEQRTPGRADIPVDGQAGVVL